MSRGQHRRQFDAEFEREAVRLSQQPGRTMASVARDLGISETNLWRWRKKLTESGDSAFPGTGHVSAEEEELRSSRLLSGDIMCRIKPFREVILATLCNRDGHYCINYVINEKRIRKVVGKESRRLELFRMNR